MSSSPRAHNHVNKQWSNKASYTNELNRHGILKYVTQILKYSLKIPTLSTLIYITALQVLLDSPPAQFTACDKSAERLCMAMLYRRNTHTACMPNNSKY